MLINRRNELTDVVIIFFVVNPLGAVVDEEDAKAVANGDARSDQQEMVSETGISRIFFLVEVVVEDEHGHHDSLSRASCHLECSSRQNII